MKLRITRKPGDHRQNGKRDKGTGNHIDEIVSSKNRRRCDHGDAVDDAGPVEERAAQAPGDNDAGGGVKRRERDQARHVSKVQPERIAAAQCAQVVEMIEARRCRKFVQKFRAFKHIGTAASAGKNMPMLVQMMAVAKKVTAKNSV